MTDADAGGPADSSDPLLLRALELRNINNQRLGMVTGGGISLVGLVVAYKLVATAEPVLGAIVATLVIGALVVVYAYGHRLKTRELDALGGAMSPNRALDAPVEIEAVERELVKVVHDADEARLIAKEVGLPSSRIHQFRTAESFWPDLIEQLQNGAVPGGVYLLVEAAYRRYPANPVFVKAHARRRLDQ